MSKRRLDALDKRILELLYEDVRISNRKVATALGVSEGAVRARIRRMQDENLVRFTATFDARSLYRPYTGFIGVDVSENCEQVCQTLAAMPEINFVAKMLGRHDIFCSFVLRERNGLAELLQNKIPAVPGVKSSQSLQVIDVYKFDRRWSVLSANPVKAG